MTEKQQSRAPEKPKENYSNGQGGNIREYVPVMSSVEFINDDVRTELEHRGVKFQFGPEGTRMTLPNDLHTENGSEKKEIVFKKGVRIQ